MVRARRLFATIMIVNKEYPVSRLTWIIFGVVVAGLLVGLVVYSHNASPQIDTSKINTSAIQKASAADGNIADHVYGDATSKVVLIEYGDFQCPYCGAAHPNVKSITQEYAGQVAFVFRNFPLTTIHPNAKAAAAVVEAAGLQGKYWEMHNLIYESQSAWVDLTGTARDNQFVAYAKQLGLNITKFDTDISSDAVLQKIAYDQALAGKLNVDSTPTFTLNGKQIDNTTLTSIVNGDGSALTTLLNTDLKAIGVTPPTS
jgi:protein-disulfide isomerase